MKPYIPYSILAAALACGMAQAVTSYTTPVGYVSLDIPANSDSTVGQPVHRAPAYSGAATGVTTNTVSVASGSLIASQFVYSSPAQPNSYYVLVTSCPGNPSLVGRYFDVVSNTTTSITADTDLAALGLTTGDSLTVIPYWTLNTLFPAGTGVGVTTVDIFDPVAFVQFRSLSVGQDRAASSTYFYYSGAEEAGTGWYNNDNLGAGIQNDLTIDPSMMATVRNLQGTANTVVVTGEVPTVTVKTPMITGASTNDNYLNTQLPIDITLGASGLSSVLTPATDIFSPIDIVFVYNDATAGFDKASFRTFFYYTGADEAGTGWYDNDNLGAGLQDASAVLKAGRAYVIRRAAGTPGTAQVATTIPYSL